VEGYLGNKKNRWDLKMGKPKQQAKLKSGGKRGVRHFGVWGRCTPSLLFLFSFSLSSVCFFVLGLERGKDLLKKPTRGGGGTPTGKMGLNFLFFAI